MEASPAKKQRTKRPSELARNNRRHGTIFKSKTISERPHCLREEKRKNCLLSCCQGRLYIPLEDLKRYIENIRSERRNVIQKKGTAGDDAYLSKLIHRSVSADEINKTTQYNYFLPCPSEENERGFDPETLIRVSRIFWCQVMLVGQVRMRRIIGQILEPRNVGEASNAGGQRHPGTDEMEDIVRKILKYARKEASHYQGFIRDSSKTYLEKSVTKFSLWQQFLQITSKEFYDQAMRLNFWPGFTSFIFKPSPEVYKNDISKMPLKPARSYSWFTQQLRKYNLKFGKLRSDTCETCHYYQEAIRMASTNDQKSALQESFNLHLQEADKAYRWRAEDHERNETDTTFLCREVDFGGGLRTPLVDLSSSYFTHIKPVYNFIIAGKKDIDYYCWQEDDGRKGVNETLSCLWEWIQENVMDRGIRHLVLWCDGCAGQMWNFTVCKFLHALTDESSPFYVQGLLRVDLKRSPVGHTYLYCDRAVGNIKFHARRIDSGIFAGFKDNLPRNLHENTWQHCIEKAKINGQPYGFRRFKYSDFRDFVAYFGQPNFVYHIPQNPATIAGDRFLISDVHWVSFGITSTVPIETPTEKAIKKYHEVAVRARASGARLPLKEKITWIRTKKSNGLLGEIKDALPDAELSVERPEEQGEEESARGGKRRKKSSAKGWDVMVTFSSPPPEAASAAQPTASHVQQNVTHFGEIWGANKFVEQPKWKQLQILRKKRRTIGEVTKENISSERTKLKSFNDDDYILYREELLLKREKLKSMYRLAVKIKPDKSLLTEYPRPPKRNEDQERELSKLDDETSRAEVTRVLGYLPDSDGEDVAAEDTDTSIGGFFFSRGRVSA